LVAWLAWRERFDDKVGRERREMADVMALSLLCLLVESKDQKAGACMEAVHGESASRCSSPKQMQRTSLPVIDNKAARQSCMPLQSQTEHHEAQHLFGLSWSSFVSR
jgi:hypothetical protein